MEPIEAAQAVAAILNTAVEKRKARQERLAQRARERHVYQVGRDFIWLGVQRVVTLATTRPKWEVDTYVRPYASVWDENVGFITVKFHGQRRSFRVTVTRDTRHQHAKHSARPLPPAGLSAPRDRVEHLLALMFVAGSFRVARCASFAPAAIVSRRSSRTCGATSAGRSYCTKSCEDREDKEWGAMPTLHHYEYTTIPEFGSVCRARATTGKR